MRRTTICRSSVLALAAALAGGAAAAAQEPQPQQPTLHVVSQGETLWALAARYFGDPLLWPEIYRLNTLVVEDPHWIFPGEELRLAPLAPTEVAADTTGLLEGDVLRPAAPTPAPPPPATGGAPSIFARGGRAEALIESIRGDAYRYRPVRRGEFYSAGFLTENEQLPWAEVRGAVNTPVLRNLQGTSSAVLFEEIEVRAPEGASYQVGDSLLVVHVGREVPDWGRVVTPTGIARVTEVSGRELRAAVLRQFGRVTDGQHALPLEPFRDPGMVVPVPIENGAMGRIIARRDLNRVATQQNILFIDLGRADGIVPGDVFEVLRERSADDPFVDQPWEALGLMHVVFVRERSASTILTHINDVGIVPGAPVRLIMKMPS